MRRVCLSVPGSALGVGARVGLSFALWLLGFNWLDLDLFLLFPLPILFYSTMTMVHRVGEPSVHRTGDTGALAPRGRVPSCSAASRRVACLVCS
jgi:hypothetical protein